MSQAKKGDQVKVHYTGKLDDGTVFDSSEGRDPLDFELGAGQVIPGFEQGTEGMEPGESKTIKIECKDAYGERREEMVQKVSKQELPDDVDPQIGQQYRVPLQNGGSVVVTVSEVTDEDVTLDANHPLAGKNLTFDIELVEIGE
ncbi:FKBP-type 16 kDa peptidyl-prolyl cis-trans isomerase [Anaerohalosphaera lusitana]|uniref:Peptidyl-prolyl cis-trans isomerase n=1 Tax=Anaerohalosphaera lusitana TaxID=1936003 RepID=A0A1U9NHG0_9BACT|nr:FKBP-type 16 kDa peptidyl-prolyl cis-trans isomerase [Anaerohalosphaera lusitana]